MHSLIRSLSLFLTVLHVHAVIVDLEIRTGGPPTSLRRRADSSTYDMTNAGNAQYVANITVGGATLPVLLDTGRWVLVDCLDSALTHSQLRLLGLLSQDTAHRRH